MKTILYKVFIILILSVGTVAFSYPQNCDWSTKAGGNGNDKAKSVSCDKEGNVYIAGTTSSSYCYFSIDTIIPKGTNDIFIVKYNNAGNEMWILQLGGIIHIRMIMNRSGGFL